MTSTPASRSALATTLAPRSCPSRPGLAMTTRIVPMIASRGAARPDGHHPQRTHATKAARDGRPVAERFAVAGRGRVARAAVTSKLLYRRVAQDQVLDAVLAAK